MTSPRGSRSPSPRCTTTSPARSSCCSSASWRASSRSARRFATRAACRCRRASACGDVLRHYGEAMASEFGWCMAHAEDQDLSPAMSRHIKALKSEIDHGIRRLIREGVQDGSIHPCDPKMTAFALAGALNWIAYWYREDQSLTGAQIAAAFLAIFENGLRPRGNGAQAARPRRAARARAPRAARRPPHSPADLLKTHEAHHVHRMSSSSPPSARRSARSRARCRRSPRCSSAPRRSKRPSRPRLSTPRTSTK